MPMTKAEKARMEELERAIKLVRAMSWPTYPQPASLTKQEIDALKEPGGERYGHRQMVARGWFANSHDRGRVSYGCSDGMHHSPDSDTTSTQGMGRMFALEVEAWRYIRHRMTERFAESLAHVDEHIRRCETAEPGAALSSPQRATP